MSAETLEWLNTNTRIGFVEKRGHAWHYRQGATNHFNGPVPVEECEALFDWEPLEAPVYAYIDDDYVLVHTNKVYYHSKTKHIFQLHGKSYVPHLYKTYLLENTADILAKGVNEGLGIGSAGLLRNGGVGWVQIELPENVDTPEGLAFRPFVTAVTSLDGSIPTTYKRMATAVVCDNTLAWGLSEPGRAYRVKHSKNSLVRLEGAREALDIIVEGARQFQDEVHRLGSWDVTAKTWSKLLNTAVPIPENPGRGRTMAETKQEILNRLYSHDERCAEWKGTALGVAQTFNTYNHHFAGVKKVSRAERNMENALKGTFEDEDQKILDILAQIAPEKVPVLVGA